ncbi:MAG: RyR domain-containing protein [Armatimonadota bacterium]
MSSGRAAADLSADPDWQGLPNLLWIPFDRMSLHAFINQGKKPLTDEQGRKAGKAVHERYIKDNRDKLMPQSVKEWSDLDPGLKNSNIEQAQYSIAVLRNLGFTVSEVQPDVEPKVEESLFTDAEVELMAEMEHGRWVVERLASGWQYGPDKDNERKISPYLLPWNELPNDIKDYDRAAVREWPVILAEAGFEVRR